MKRYKVCLYETMRHELMIEAESPGEAVGKAYTLVSNEKEETLVENYEYEVDGEYNGSYEVFEEATL